MQFLILRLTLETVNKIKLIKFILNQQTIATTASPGTALLDFIRYHQQLTGTKIGCREGDCGACTVLVGELEADRLRYRSVTSCLMPIGNANGKHIVTVEGLNFPTGLNMIQNAMAEYGATQCGFCTPGFVVALSGFCLGEEAPTPENAIASIDGNICRCTGYKSIERAALSIVQKLEGKKDPVAFAVENGYLPPYFSTIRERLQYLGGQLMAAALKDAASLEERPHFVGGGTDLYVQKHEEMKEASIRFLFDHPSYNRIRQEGNRCIMGPSVTVSDLRHSLLFQKVFPAFHSYSKLVSSTPIRNMATVAGNFVNASPIGDLTIFFLALDADLLLEEDGRSRNLPLRKLYKGYKSLDKSPGEQIEEISFEIPGPDTFFHFEKVSKRTHLDIASVNSAIRLKVKDRTIIKAGLSAGGVGPVPLFLEKTSAFLEGQTLGEELAEKAIQIMQTEISPISDARGSRAYKTLLAGQLIRAHFQACLNQFTL